MVTITKEEVTKLNTRLKISIPSQDYQPLIDSSLKNLRKKVELKGFRKGMVPISLVKKMYGNQVLADELNKLINNELTEYLKENDLDILGSPIPVEEDDQSIDIESNRDYSFKYELGLSPEFELSVLDKQTKIDHYKIKADKEIVDKEIERLKKQLGTMTNPDDEVREDDVIYVHLRELDEDGSPKEDGIGNTTAIPMDMITDKKVKENILKLKPGGQTDLDIYKSFDKSVEEINKNILNLEDQKEKVNAQFRLKLEKINRMIPAEINQDFFDKVFGKDTVKSEEEFRAKLKEEIEKAFSRERDAKLNSDIVNYLIDQTPIDLPDDFLQRWIVLTNEKPISEEQVKQEYDDFARGLKWNLIVGKIKKENDIEVKEDELKEHTRQSIQAQFGLGDTSEHDEQMAEWVNHLLKNKEHVNKTYEQLLTEKILNLVKDRITLNAKEVTVEEFKNLNQTA